MPKLAPEPPISSKTTAQMGEIRAWALKGYWAENRGDLAEAQRCFQWVLRLDGDNPAAKEAVDAFVARHRKIQ